MTRREARKSLGSRTTRRNGTKTKVLPKSNGKRPPKSRHFHRRKPRVSVLVAQKMKTVNTNAN